MFGHYRKIIEYRIRDTKTVITGLYIEKKLEFLFTNLEIT